MYKLEKFKLDRKGVSQLLKSEDMRKMIFAEAEARMPSGCEIRTSRTDRVGAVIEAVEPKAIRDNLKNNTLLRAIGK